MLDTRELEIPQNLMESEWKSNKVVLTEYDTEMAGKIKSAGIRANISNAGLNGAVNLEALVVESIRVGVIEAPWVVSGASVEEQRRVIAKLRNKLTSWIFRELEEMNEVPDKKKVSSEDGV